MTSADLFPLPVIKHHYSEISQSGPLSQWLCGQKKQLPEDQNRLKQVSWGMFSILLVSLKKLLKFIFLIFSCISVKFSSLENIVFSDLGA